MKKSLLAVAVLMLISPKVMAGPLTDLIIGVGMLATGGVFEYERQSATSDRDAANTKATQNYNSWQIDLVNANYYKGAADWEFLRSGNTAAYQNFYYNFSNYFRNSQFELSTANSAANDYADANDKANLYKGVSLTSFGVGGAFIIKAGIEWLVEKNQTKTASAKKYQWVLLPTDRMDGMKLQMNY